MEKKIGDATIAQALHDVGAWCCDDLDECEEIVEFVKELVLKDAINAIKEWEYEKGQTPFSKVLVIDLIRKSGEGT